MGQYLLTFGVRNAAACWRIATTLLGREVRVAQVLPTGSRDSLEFVPSFKEPDEVLRELATRLLASVLVTTAKPGVRHAFLNVPRAFEDSPPFWECVVEYSAANALRDAWGLVLREEEVMVVAAGLEESVALHALSHLSRFPWDDPFLILGAVREPEQQEGLWTVHTGPALERATSISEWATCQENAFQPGTLRR